ncbi:MAG: NAD(P)-dependent oxidoreductase [Pedobacter sp.]|nr:NAD(P)-dependent oxidoreductase [Pedobacter sp.]MDQ8052270.1 NAD(P)-dependent oxidoreductase [Pedobacter sp.]
MKAFLGTGLLGSNFVKAMIGRGDRVQVWNRTAAKAKALETDGAIAFGQVADAVQGAEVIHVTLKDDAAVDEVLANASSGLSPGATIIDHTTTSVEGAIERTRAWKAKGFTYLHAPVFMGPPNALDASGSMLVSGDQEIIGKWSEELSRMTGKLMNFGPEEGMAAGMKLIGNLFLISMTAGISDALALAKALNIDSSNIADLFAAWNPGAGAPARLDKLRKGEFDKPSWELQMARKDAGLMMDAAKQRNIQLTVIPAVAEQMDNWIKKGHASADWTVIAKENI